MPAQQKPKSSASKTRNDTRPNGKKNKGAKPHTRRTVLSHAQKVLLGVGSFQTWIPVGADPRTQNTGKGRV